LKADFSTANPTSAYDTSNFGKVRNLFAKSALLLCEDSANLAEFASVVGRLTQVRSFVRDDRNFCEAPNACPAVHRKTKKSL
jgi:hypothetical protein